MAVLRITYNGASKVIRRLCEIANAGTETHFYEHDAHPLDDIAVNPGWAYWDNGYAETDGSTLWAHTPLYPPILFTDKSGYVCAAYDDGNDSGGDIQ